MYQNLKIHYGNLVSVMMLKKIKKRIPTTKVTAGLIHNGERSRVGE